MKKKYIKTHIGTKYIKHNNSGKNTENYILLGMFGTTLLSGALLTLPSALADDSAVTDVAITVPVACAVTSTVGTAHTATIDNGTYEDDIGTTTIKTTCNDSQGFSIYAIGYTNEEYGNTVLKPSTIDSPQNDIATGIATNGDTSNWAMKLTASTGMTSANILSDTDGAYSNYHKVPTTYTKVATMSSSTNATTGASIEATYAAYIAGDQPADIYTGKVKYTMVHPANEQPLQPQSSGSGKICYYANASGYEGTMGCQNISRSVTLLASNFSREGYGFAGWSDKFDYSTGAHFYGPNETISIPDTSIYTGEGKGLSLYAVWIVSQGSLQDSSKVAQLCGTGAGSLTQAPIDGTANKSSVSALTDERDNQTYAIAKLADGNCWMIENLRLDNTAELTLANTNNPLNDGTNVTLKHNYTDTTTYNTLSATSSDAYDATNAPNGWCSNKNAACYDQSRLRTDNTTSRTTGNPNVNTGSMYSYGNYYNWYSATAGNGTYSKTSGEVAGDLCPAGWKLPLGNTSTGNLEQGASDTANKVGGFSYLDRKMGGTGDYQSTAADSLRWRKFPLNFVYSGSVDNRGSYGHYWSSTAFSDYYAYNLCFSSSNVYPGTRILDKYLGLSIRCLAVPSV